MIPDNEYLDLPDDPEQAFAVLHRRKNQELIEKLQTDSENGWDHERQYVDFMLVFDDAMNLGYLSEFSDVPDSSTNFSAFYRRFRRHVEMICQKNLIFSAQRQKKGIETLFVFDEAQRSAIQHLIQQIRDNLEQSKLPENKREALFNKLNAFAAEVDRNRTRAEAFYAFAIDTARAAKEVNEEIKPLQQTIDKIFDWIDKAKKYTDTLPPWNERKQIEAPRKQIEAPSNPETSNDDDIPF